MMPKHFQHKAEPPDLPTNIRLKAGPDHLEIVYTSRYWFGGLWPLIFGAIWTTGIISATITEIEKGPSWSLLLVVPFYLVSLFLMGATARNYFHRETLRIDETGLTWRLSAIVPIYHRRVSWDHLIAIQDGCRYGERSLIRGWGLGIETDEKAFYLFLDLDYREEGEILKQYLTNYLADFCTRYGIVHPPCTGESKESKTHRREALYLRETPESLELSGVPEVRWEYRVFSIVWITGWTIGCITLSVTCFSSPPDTPWVLWFFVTLFWAIWLFVTPIMLMMNWRWETLHIDGEEVKYSVSLRLPFLFLPFQSRRVPIHDLGLAEPYAVHNNGYNETGIQVPTTGKPIRCFKTQCGTCSAFAFIDALNDRLREYGVTEESRFRNKKENASEVAPLDSRWTFHDDGVTQTLTRKGHVSARVFLTTLFVTVFINGIVSLFAVGAIVMWMEGKEPVFLPYFIAIIITPFLLLGFVALVTMLMILLQFFCRYTITLDTQGVRYRRSWFGVGRKRHWTFSDIGQVVIRRKAGNLRWRDTIRNPELADTRDGVTNPYPFYVQILDPEEQPLGVIPDLLEGEARWIASKIRQRERWSGQRE